MNLNEAREKFPVGSLVKVIDCGHCFSSYNTWAANYLNREDYMDWDQRGIWLDSGDVGEVICIYEHEHIDTYNPIAAVRIRGKKIFLIEVDGIKAYESEEPFEGAQIPESKFSATNEKEKKPYTPTKTHFVCSFDGTALTVDAFGKVVTRDVSEILDEMVNECEILANAVSVGDAVVITDRDHTYSTYDDFVKKYLCFDQAMTWQYGRYPKNGSVGKVIIKKPHLHLNGKEICVVEIEDDGIILPEIYLIDVRGLRKVETAE